MSDDKQVIQTQNTIKINVPVAVLVQLIRDHGDCGVDLPPDAPSAYLSHFDNQLQLEWTIDGPSPMPF